MRRHPWVMVILATVLMWDWPGDPSQVSMFLIFVRSEGHSYDWSNPRVPVEGKDGRLVTQVTCTSLPLVSSGPWWAVVAAMTTTGELSLPSNELTFWFDPRQGCVPLWLPVTPSPPDGPLIPVPPPLVPPPDISVLYPPVVMTPPTYVPLPKPTSTGNDLTDSCAWTGCRATVPPTKPSSGDIMESCHWTGTCP